MRKRMTHAERRAETRRSLLDTARAIFLERGYHATTLEQIAEAAGFTKGAVYAHFESKADLVLALIEERIEERLKKLRELSALDLPPAELARVVYRYAASDTRAHMRWGLLTIEFRVHAMRDEALTGRYLELHTRLRDGLARTIAGAFRRAGIKPRITPEQQAMVGLVLGTGAMLERWTAGQAFPDDVLEEVQGPLFEFAVNGPIRARAPKAARSRSRSAAAARNR